MAKKPQSGMDEEEIIRRRDGIAGPASDDPLDADAKRALADARLRALAFALSSEQSPRAVTEEIDDTELLAYLLDALPEQRRIALEETLRGNPRAFGWLMTLRNAFSSQTDKRDRKRADHPARRIPRHTAGRIDIRRMGEILQFRDATRPRPSFDVAQFASAALAFEPRAYRASRPLAFRQMKRPRLEWDEKMKGMFRSVLERARRDLDAATSIVNDIQSLLEGWWNINRREDSEARERDVPGDYEAEDLQERLAELLRDLEIAASQIKDELGDVASLTAGMFPTAQIAASPSLDALVEKRGVVALHARSVPSDREMWADFFDLEAGPWGLHLVGIAFPKPQLVVSVRANQMGAPSVEPFLTLVRPTEGFEMVNLDSSGNGKIALPVGESVMLLQADEIWKVHLSFRDERGV